MGHVDQGFNLGQLVHELDFLLLSLGAVDIGDGPLLIQAYYFKVGWQGSCGGEGPTKDSVVWVP